MNWETAYEKIRNIGNQFSGDLAKVLFDEVTRLPDDAVILEIGALYGFSTCSMGCACVGTDRHVWTIDTFIGNPHNTNLQDGEDYYDVFTQNVRDCKLQDYITALWGRTERWYAWWQRPLDLLFIDGDHTIMQEDLDAFYPHLVTGGTLVMHDVTELNETWRTIRRQLDDVHLVSGLGWGSKK
jgi:predicted O-methyltransferase YrrM